MNLGDEVQKLVEAKGYAVLRNTKYCELFRSTHDNCAGCESEEGCKAVAEVMIIMMGEAFLLGKDCTFEEMLKSGEDVVKRVNRVLNKGKEEWNTGNGWNTLT